nr:unnamed protein product [Digitaria exilis]
MPVARPEPQEPRVIAHVDMDCFYAQVEQRRNPALRGQPTAVVQYNDWKGGGLIAVSYEARAFGVKRRVPSMRGDEAKRVCPGINLVQVPVARGKADLSLYRSAGSEVVTILASKGKCERASIDEVYLDLTDAAKDMLLQAPPNSPDEIFMEAAKSNILGLPSNASEKEKNVRTWLCRVDAEYEDKTWLWKIARGISGEEVEDRLLPKSHGCGKTFPGPKALKNSTYENERDSVKKFPSKSCPLRYGIGKIQDDAMKLFESGLHEFLESQSTGWSITSLSVTASKIFDIPSGTSSILRYIKGPSSAASLDLPASSSVPEDPSLGDVLDSKQCEPSTSEKVDAKRYSANEGKKISKKLPEVKVLRKQTKLRNAMRLHKMWIGAASAVVLNGLNPLAVTHGCSTLKTSIQK